MIKSNSIINKHAPMMINKTAYDLPKEVTYPVIIDKNKSRGGMGQPPINNIRKVNYGNFMVNPIKNF